jgi:hypothetical protein
MWLLQKELSRRTISQLQEQTFLQEMPHHALWLKLFIMYCSILLATVICNIVILFPFVFSSHSEFLPIGKCNTIGSEFMFLAEEFGSSDP